MEKIFIVGAHGAGKTTLINTIAKELKEENIPVQVIPELARFMIDIFQFDPFYLHKETWIEFQATLFEYYLFVHYFSSPCPILSDRSVFDVLAYIKVGNYTKSTSFNVYNYEGYIIRNKEKINKCLEKHKSIFYFYLIDNPQLPYQTEVQKYLLDTLDKFYIRPIFFRRENVEEIKEEIKAKIKKASLKEDI